MPVNYYENQSIGDMLMRAGLAYSQIKKQEEARKQQNLMQAINIVSSIPKLPESLRKDQGFLKGIDETLGQMGSKIRLPKNTEKSIMDAVQTKAKGLQPGGMTPVGQIENPPQVGEYAPFTGDMKRIYSLAGGKPAMVGEIERDAIIDPMDQLKRGEALAKERFELGQRAADAAAERQYERDNRRDELSFERQKKLGELGLQRQKEYHDYTQKGGEGGQGLIPTGEHRVVEGFMRQYFRPTGPNGEFTAEDFKRAQKVLKPLEDLESKYQNDIMEKVHKEAQGLVGWARRPSTKAEAEKIAKETGNKPQESQEEWLDKKLDFYKKYYKMKQPKYRTDDEGRGGGGSGIKETGEIREYNGKRYKVIIKNGVRGIDSNRPIE